MKVYLLDLTILDLEHFKVSAGLVFFIHPLAAYEKKYCQQTLQKTNTVTKISLPVGTIADLYVVLALPYVACFLVTFEAGVLDSHGPWPLQAGVLGEEDR